MAISANAVWEIRTTATAANANGGFFVTGASGSDFSQQNAAQFNLTGAISAGADAVILHASAATTMVGNGAHVISGTNAIAGWYEILSVVAGVSITLDRAWGSGIVASGIVNIGGALSLGSSDDAVFENGVAGQKFYVKSGTYTLGGTVSISAAGSSTVVIALEGYASSRGDKPTGATRPIFDAGAAAFTLGNNWDATSMIWTSTAANSVITGGASKMSYCKFLNTSTTVDRVACSLSTDSFAVFCEAISIRGRAFQLGADVDLLFSYAHDSDIGVVITTTTGPSGVRGCIIESNVTAAISYTGAETAPGLLTDNTLFGGITNKTGIGVSFAAGCTDMRVINNIIYGFATGVSHGTAGQTIGFDDYNDYFNNTADATNWTKGAHDAAVNPSFSNVAQVTGTQGTTASSILTDAAANFSNVVANQDYLYLISGTGITVGQYLITAKTTTTVTLSPAPGNNVTADKVYQVTTGRNFAVGSALKGIGAPGAFPGSLTTGSSDIGAAQTAESGSTGNPHHLGVARMG